MNKIIGLIFLLCQINNTIQFTDQCDVCFQFGYCDFAYHHKPGKFCHLLISNSTINDFCCCSVNDICPTDHNTCLCNNTYFNKKTALIILFMIISFFTIYLIIYYYKKQYKPNFYQHLDNQFIYHTNEN